MSRLLCRRPRPRTQPRGKYNTNGPYSEFLGLALSQQELYAIGGLGLASVTTGPAAYTGRVQAVNVVRGDDKIWSTNYPRKSFSTIPALPKARFTLGTRLWAVAGSGSAVLPTRPVCLWDRTFEKVGVEVS